jgi:hypothetical protein
LSILSLLLYSQFLCPANLHCHAFRRSQSAIPCQSSLADPFSAPISFPLSALPCQSSLCSSLLSPFSPPLSTLSPLSILYALSLTAFSCQSFLRRQSSLPFQSSLVNSFFPLNPLSPSSSLIIHFSPLKPLSSSSPLVLILSPHSIFFPFQASLVNPFFSLNAFSSSSPPLSVPSTLPVFPCQSSLPTQSFLSF